jgi:hypothetical protein
MRKPLQIIKSVIVRNLALSSLRGYKATPRISVDECSIDDLLDLVLRKVVGRHMDHFNLAHLKRGIVSDVSTADTGPEEPNQSVLLLRLGQCSVSPGCAKILHGVEINFVQVLVSLAVCPKRETVCGRSSRAWRAWTFPDRGSWRRLGICSPHTRSRFATLETVQELQSAARLPK